MHRHDFIPSSYKFHIHPESFHETSKLKGSHNRTWNRNAAALKAIALNALRLPRRAVLRLDDRRDGRCGCRAWAIMVHEGCVSGGAHFGFVTSERVSERGSSWLADLLVWID